MGQDRFLHDTLHAHMDRTFRHSVHDRQYRLMTFVLVVGSLSAGVLLLRRLTDALRESIFWYYGVPMDDFHEMQELGSGSLSLTLGQLTVAVLAFLGALAFVTSERRRLNRFGELDAACGRENLVQAVATLTWRQRRDVFIVRSLLFSGVLLLSYVLQVSFERYMSGQGWGLQYADWTSLLPLASIFGLCFLVGMVVAGISMFGLRVIGSLETMLADLATGRTGAVRARVFRYWCEATSVPLSERFGNALLSRPPPAACVVAA